MRKKLQLTKRRRRRCCCEKIKRTEFKSSLAFEVYAINLSLIEREYSFVEEAGEASLSKVERLYGEKKKLRAENAACKF